MDNKTKVLIVSSGRQVSSQVLLLAQKKLKEKGFLEREKPESLRHKMEELLPHPHPIFLNSI